MALAFLNENSDGMPRWLDISLADLKLSPTMTYNFTEAFEMKTTFVITKNKQFKVSVNPHGVQLYVVKQL